MRPAAMHTLDAPKSISAPSGLRPRTIDLAEDLDQERRHCPRRGLRTRLLLRDPSNSEAEAGVHGLCLNISRDGLYATVPIGYGLGVGQLYTFEMTIAERGPEPGTLQRVAQRGRIVRTDLLLSPEGDRLGIGVRLVGPRLGIVPMPQ